MNDYENQWTITTKEDYNIHKDDIINYYMCRDDEGKIIYFKKKEVSLNDKD